MGCVCAGATVRLASGEIIGVHFAAGLAFKAAPVVAVLRAMLADTSLGEVAGPVLPKVVRRKVSVVL